MGNTIQRISFEDVQYAQSNQYVIISTLPTKEQDMLILKTVPCDHEITAVENAIRAKTPIIIYGKHANDESVYVKYKQIYIISMNVFKLNFLQNFGNFWHHY